MALLPPEFLNCVVGIRSEIPGIPNADWMGTGFIFASLAPASTDKLQPYLVTNRHVVEGFDSIVLVFSGDPKRPPSEVKIDTGHAAQNLIPNRNGLDLAVLPLDRFILDGNTQAFRPILAKESLTAGLAKEIGVTEGDGVFIVTLPMGLEGLEDQIGPLVKQGCIARIGHYLAGQSSHILIDAHVTHGNSGSPVFLKPSGFALQGTRGNSFPYLLGILEGRFIYEEPAVSPLTNRTRVVFEEHSGITKVLTADDILDTIEFHTKDREGNEAPGPN